MKQTPFYEVHKKLGAKMAPFAGFEMPIDYSGIKKEHFAVRESVGVFDVSHMGEFWVKGPQAFAFLQLVTSNDISLLKPGKAQYSCLPNREGGIVDDLVIYQYEEEKYMVVVNAANIEKDWQHCLENNPMEAELENASDNIGQLAIQGPNAIKVLQKLTDIDLCSIPYYHFSVGKIAGIEEVIISNTGYTGAGGFELYFYPQDAIKLWDAIFEAGAEFNIQPIGLAARDTLRLEKGFCLYGNDIDDSTSPLEAGLGWITKFTVDNNFINRKSLEEQKENGLKKRLKGFIMEEKGIPRHGYEICDNNGNGIGNVTSGTMSPILNKGIGLGYVTQPYWKPGAEINIKVRNKLLKAKITKTPFV